MKRINIIYNANDLAKNFFTQESSNKEYETIKLFAKNLLDLPNVNVYFYVNSKYYAEEFALSLIYTKAFFFHTFFSYPKAGLAKILSTLVKQNKSNFLVLLIRLIFKIFEKKDPSFKIICKNADVFISTSSKIPKFVQKYGIAFYTNLLNQGNIADIVCEITKSNIREKLNIIYRMCDAKKSSSSSNRCFDVCKNELIKKCLKSIKENINNYRGSISFYCIADNCSDDIIEYLKGLFPNVNLKRFDKIGNAKSFCECTKLACNLPDGEQVYFLEDDYLLLNNDVLNNINFGLTQLSKEQGVKIGIMPDDYPDRYSNNAINTECHVTEIGHFLKIDKSTCTFATYADVVKKNRKYLMKFSKWPRVTERGSVNRVWEKVPLYQPIPAWTLHCQVKSVVPMYLDYEKIRKYIETGTL